MERDREAPTHIGDSALTSMPVSWKLRALGTNAEVLSGFAFSSAGFSQVDGLPLVRIRDLGNSRTEVRYKGPYDERFVVHEGDILVGMDGDFNAARWSGGEALLNQRVCKISAQSDVLDDGYLYHLLQPKLDEIHRRTPQTTVRHLSAGNIEAILFAAPPVTEQRQIAEILDTVDEAIRRTEQLVAKLERMKQGLVHDLLTHGIDGDGSLDDAETLLDPWERAATTARADGKGHIPSLGEWVAQGEIELGRGKVISRLDIERIPGLYPIYSSSAAGDGEFGRYGRYMFDEELITWSVDGGGRPFYRPRHRFSVTNVGGFLRIRAKSKWTYRYVHALLEYQHARLTFDWQTKAHPSVIRNLYSVPLIPLADQMRIADILDAFSERLRCEMCEADKLRLVKTGLADELLNGRVRVTEWLEGDTA